MFPGVSVTNEVNEMARDMKTARERRALEARRDAILNRIQRDRSDLAAIRAKLKAMRTTRRRTTT